MPERKSHRLPGRSPSRAGVMHPTGARTLLLGLVSGAKLGAWGRQECRNYHALSLVVRVHSALCRPSLHHSDNNGR